MVSLSSGLRKSLRIVPIGGLGEIGMNMLMIEWFNESIIIDCGVKFPDQFYPGIDLVLPGLSYALKSKTKIKAVILTHGHEDHIGALPFLLRQKNIPVYGSLFTLELVKNKLAKHDLLDDAKLNLVEEGDVVELGAFQIEFIQMAHSICDALGLCIDTPEGRIIHTGDFKLDKHPADGRKTDIERFKKLGKKGVLLLLSDSTNVEVPGYSKSEKTVYEGLEEIIKDTKGWYVLSSFASHIPRIGQVIELAQNHKRKILVLGRAMKENIYLAKRTGHLEFDDSLMVEENAVRKMPRNKLIVLSTGSQGEPRSALARMAYGELKNIELEKGDQVVLSSRMIPGNEKAIFEIINQLYRRGAHVSTSAGSDIHVSGHGYQEDLREMLKAVSPTYFVPIHGEYRHLVLHQELASQTNIHFKKCILLENGQSIEFEKGQCKHLPDHHFEPTVVMENDLSYMATDMIKDRRTMNYAGAVSVVVLMDRKSKKLKSLPMVAQKGVVFAHEESFLIANLTKLIGQKIEKPHGQDAQLQVDEHIRRLVRRFTHQHYNRKPAVFPVIIEV